MDKERFKAKIAVHLLLTKSEEILLLRRYNTGYEDGNYSVVAGHLDGDEKVTDAMIREAAEEAGIHIKEEHLKVVGFMHRRSDDERIDFFLHCTQWEGEVRNMEPHKCDELKWFPMKELPENTISYVRKSIDNFNGGISFCEYGW